MKIGVIVLSWNSKNLIADCLDGLIKYEPSAHIYVVDNNSADDSVDLLRKKYPSIHLICSIKNLGFSDGNNVGIEAAIKDDCDAVILLNNDTIIDEPFISPLVDCVVKDNSVGIIGPVIVEGNTPDIIQCAGGKINLWFARFSYLDKGKEYIRVDRVNEVGYVLGAAFLITREVIEKIGYLDQEYFPAYVEEADYCYRAKLEGFRSLIHHGVRVRHLGGKSSGGSKNEFRRMINHRFLFAIKHLSAFQFLVAASSICVRVFIKKFINR